MRFCAGKEANCTYSKSFQKRGSVFLLPGHQKWAEVSLNVPVARKEMCCFHTLCVGCFEVDITNRAGCDRLCHLPCKGTIASLVPGFAEQAVPHGQVALLLPCFIPAEFSFRAVDCQMPNTKAVETPHLCALP